MTNQRPDSSGAPRDWAEHVVSCLDGRDDTDWTLHESVRGTHNLAAETNERRARAVHAAAMGLGPAGRAAAAGVSEAMLSRWCAQNPLFDAALMSAAAMAAAEEVAEPGRLSGMSLGLLLQTVVRGTGVTAAAAAVNLRYDQLRRLRERNPDVDRLIRAAVTRARARRMPKARKPAFTYRVIRDGEPTQAAAKAPHRAVPPSASTG
ncbi:hypothetical protein [Streptomyces sp. NPDC058701]|uniref:hypothetical protein n=1 Tax=Streptomyces sp. NPDC058701 TaxID=3346608 RepID=UPI00365688E0